MENRRENNSVISKLKVSGNRRDALSERLFFERLFGAANFHPPGISERALVCIRKIQAPPPENKRQGSGVLALDWEIGIRRRVEQMLRRAFRPVRETVPAEALCVIFEDRAEMLACLARDWLTGSLTSCWWWRALFPKLFLAETIFDIWLGRAEFAPAAFSVLSKNGAAKEFVQKLDRSENIQILHAVARIFGLGKLSAVLTQPVERTAPTVSKSGGHPASNVFRENENLLALAGSNKLFGLLIPESKATDLSFERQVLLETALLLARSPRIARSPEFTERVVLIRRKHEFAKNAAGAESVAVIENKNLQDLDITEQFRRGKGEAPVSKPSSGKNEPYFSGAHETQKSERLSGEKPTVSRKKRKPSPKSSVEAKKQKVAPPVNVEFETVRPEITAEPSALKNKPRDPDLSKTASPEESFENFFEPVESVGELVFQTRFGGVFYLLNLGLYLGLYRDFTEALTTEIDLNIWDFVALLGYEFLGEQIKTDAVWDFLKRAAERDNDRHFGREFDSARDWRTPPAWLATFPENQTWTWTKHRKRLVVRHSQDFSVLDIRQRGRADKQLRGELEIYREHFAQIVKADAKDQPPESKGWLQNLAEYLRKRLFQALNVQTTEALSAVLFERRARVTVSATHLEITFALADLPIEVRLAGLDRNPAWIPAAGKFVYFHFE